MPEYIELGTLAADTPADIKIKAINPQIVVSGKADNPYYSISYYDVVKKEWFMGYSSYNLEYVFKWLDECFEKVESDMAEVIHGEWIQGGTISQECSCCGFEIDDDATYELYFEWRRKPKFCPECGAKMDGTIGGDDAR